MDTELNTNLNTVLAELSKPFPASELEWRVGSTNADKTKGIALAYLTARAVMDRLDAVLGIGGWSDAYQPIITNQGLLGFTCTLSIWVDGMLISKQDAADISDIESVKGGVSDALKRAAVKFGVGRYLYNLPNVWVPIASAGRSFKLTEYPKLPAWALPKSDITEDPNHNAFVEEVAKANALQTLVDKLADTTMASEPTQTNEAIADIKASMIDIMASKPGRKASDKAANFAHLLLNQAIPDQNKRHAFCTNLFGVDAWNKVDLEDMAAFLDWLQPIKFEKDGKTRYKLPDSIFAKLQAAS